MRRKSVAADNAISLIMLFLLNINVIFSEVTEEIQKSCLLLI